MITTLRPYGLATEQLTEPLGIGEPCPRLSWKVSCDRRGAAQSAYRITAAQRPEDLDDRARLVWDSGRRASSDGLLVPWDGPVLCSATRYHWRVEVWDELGARGGTGQSWFETGLLHRDDWTAGWVGRDPLGLPPVDPPSDDDPAPLTGAPLYLRRRFELDRHPMRARLYATAVPRPVTCWRWRSGCCRRNSCRRRSTTWPPTSRSVTTGSRPGFSEPPCCARCSPTTAARTWPTPCCTREFPSWGHSIRHGATTIWERWDGWTEHAGFQSAAMNSFNHYSLGSVGDWLYGRVAGIDQTPDSVAYRELLLRPLPGGNLTWARAEQETVRGRVACGWSRTEGTITVTATVPPGSIAVLHIPTADPHSVRESGAAAADQPGVLGVEPSSTGVTLRLTSGHYTVSATAPSSQEAS